MSKKTDKTFAELIGEQYDPPLTSEEAEHAASTLAGFFSLLAEIDSSQAEEKQS